ncbi:MULTISPECIES: helix-turn-helix domain-containing protein [Bacteria]|uniref:helix-turn-helix domain-containing protein n=1 Tax=Bacteria TaxID=2 RepID=UPI001330EDD0|nr:MULTISPECIES: helix-turn-helix domain-containing protein [Bacteria]MCH1670742.1 helix-turn-helix domain-containing protein [Enterococcus faecalis]
MTLVSNYSSRLKQIMSERGLRQVDILNMSIPYQKKLGITMTKSHLSQYVNGKSNPDQNRIYLLSKTLDVNEPWLMGFDVSEKRIPDEKRSSGKNDLDIVPIFNQLEPKLQQLIYNEAKSYLEKQNKASNNVVNINKKKYDTLAAHSPDPDKVFTDEEKLKINQFLDKVDADYDRKQKECKHLFDDESDDKE